MLIVLEISENDFFLFFYHVHHQLGKAIGVKVLEVGVGVCTETAYDDANHTNKPETTQDPHSETPACAGVCDEQVAPDFARETTTKASERATDKAIHQATQHPTPKVSQEAAHKAPSSSGDGYSVVEAGRRAVVGPRVELLDVCGCDSVVEPWSDHHTCSTHTCLNGGRCLSTLTGYRCVKHLLLRQ